jgi:NodT family efflux transporter outer membrane factor (OMF) lipoprotein
VSSFSAEPISKSRRQIGRGLLALPLLFSCASCALDPAPDASVDIPGHFNGTPAGGEFVPGAGWWRAFRSGELNRFIEEATRANFDIAVAIARIQEADAAAGVAGASLLPSVTGTADATQSKAASGSGNGGGKPRALYTVQGAASYELDFWGKNRATAQAAAATANASRFDSRTVTLTAQASTATTYVNILEARERIGIAESNLRSSERILDLIRNRLSAGTASALDEAQQAALVAKVRASIPPLRQVVEQNTAVLAILLGRAPERIKVADSSLNSLAVPRIRPGVPSNLLVNRPDIASAEASLEAAHANLEAARVAFFPSIQLTAQGGYESLALKSLFSPATTFYSLAAGLTQPIFDGGKLASQYDQDKAKQDELVAAYRKAVISAFGDVEKALSALRQTAEQENLLRQSVAASRKAFDLSELRLREGTVDLVSVLQTQQNLFDAQDTLAQAHASRLLAAISLFQALGGDGLGVAATQ